MDFRVSVVMTPSDKTKPGPKAKELALEAIIRETRVYAQLLALLREAHKQMHYRNEDVKEALLWTKIWLNPEQARSRGNAPVVTAPFTKTINTITLKATLYDK